MEIPRNPFILGHRIDRPYFCDREREEEQLTDAVINGRNIVLLSPRRMGKTSLINMVLQNSPQIKDYYQTFFIDILQTTTLSEFTYLLGKAVFKTLKDTKRRSLKGFLAALKSLKGSFGFDPINGSPTFDIRLGDIQQPQYTLEEFFNYLETNDVPVILVIDEFQQITEYPEKNTEALLRSHMQRMKNVTFIFAGSEFTVLQEMFLNSKRPFYNSSQMMHLGPINEDVYVGFTETLFKERRRNIDEEAVRLAYSIFGGNTFYVQRTMNGAFADTAEGERCGADTVRRSIHAMLAANEVLYREMLSRMNISQKSVLIAVARERKVSAPTGAEFMRRNALATASSVQNALKKLIREGTVTRNTDGYSVTDPLLRLFVNSLYSEPEI